MATLSSIAAFDWIQQEIAPSVPAARDLVLQPSDFGEYFTVFNEVHCAQVLSAYDGIYPMLAVRNIAF